MTKEEMLKKAIERAGWTITNQKDESDCTIVVAKKMKEGNAPKEF